ncbi:MAG: gamma-glutamyl-gamma-aminobutyrate hydrolase family protein [Xanthomonadales bacterium]|nr:gamma-glutamyl-gamma-aminobutyrate hydrolase family protein [Gammaproteobacteria bacterium]NNK52490.1 gamma-glutamyl-gamma-aminobutyrate hydrolase family protein [Xanthomonadales bacterium]
MQGNRPLIGVISDRRMQGKHPFHMVGEKYLQAVADGSDAYPVGLPLLNQGFDVLDILDRLDGIFLTGSPSNVEPLHYLGDPSKPGTWHDPHRDLAALALIPAAIRVGMPLMAVCRGFQEMNVSFGGTLHQMVHELPEYGMHKENPDDPLEAQYGPSHRVTFSRGGLLEKITGTGGAMVNSLHSQGVNRLGEELNVEAVADDGLIEAFSVSGAPGFTLAVQWHPEWRVLENPVSTAIFRAFGDACRAYRLRGLNA